MFGFFCTLASFLIGIVLASPITEKQTYLLPDGITINGSLVCRETKWTDVITFFALNYILHALTVRIPPGISRTNKIIVTITCLLFPYAGIFQALVIILDCPILGKTQLEKAQRARAVWTLARSATWRPKPGEEILVDGCILISREGEIFEKDGRKDGQHSVYMESRSGSDGKNNSAPVKTPMDTKMQYHGRHWFPEGYELVPVNPQVKIEPGSRVAADMDEEFPVSFSENVLGSMVSIGQILAAVYSLYKARGDQFEKYGYSAFALTVVPYIFMTFLNLVSNLISHDYPSIFIVRSAALEEAERRDSRTFVECEVGGIAPSAGSGSRTTVLFRGAEKNGRILYKVMDNGSAIDWKEAHQCITPKSPLGRDYSVSYPPFGCYEKLQPQKFDVYRLYIALPVVLLMYITPYMVIGILTKYKAGQSSVADRGWTASWLVIGQVYGLVMYGIYDFDFKSSKNWCDYFIVGLMSAVAATPAIGGLYTVGKQLMETGWCEDI